MIWTQLVIAPGLELTLEHVMVVSRQIGNLVVPTTSQRPLVDPQS